MIKVKIMSFKLSGKLNTVDNFFIPLEVGIKVFETQNIQTFCESYNKSLIDCDYVVSASSNESLNCFLVKNSKSI